jgi:hypothetical protein
MVEPPRNERRSFTIFYETTYRSDHQHPANLALHILGVIAGLGLIAASLTIWPLWSAVAFPIVHAAPGLIGHRLFDRDEALGDVRLTRTDYPLWWFIAANHMMTVAVLMGRWSRV